MAGWVPFPADMWEETAEALAHPWPLGAAVMDLRWHICQGKVPDLQTLCKRWGWAEAEVRKLLKDW